MKPRMTGVMDLENSPILQPLRRKSTRPKRLSLASLFRFMEAIPVCLLLNKASLLCGYHYCICGNRMGRVRHTLSPGAALCVERWTEATRAILWGGTMCEEIGQSPHTASWGGTVCKGFGQSPQVILAPSWGGIVCTEIGQSPQATLAASWGSTVR